MEIALADDSKKNAANNQFRKLRQAEEGKRAMTEYENNAIASPAGAGEEKESHEEKSRGRKLDSRLRPH
jgi:hypothetical protein